MTIDVSSLAGDVAFVTSATPSPRTSRGTAATARQSVCKHVALEMHRIAPSATQPVVGDRVAKALTGIGRAQPQAREPTCLHEDRNLRHASVTASPGPGLNTSRIWLSCTA
jgi:hypothetical protein